MKNQDFQKVQPIVDKSVEVLEVVRSVDLSKVDKDARDYALSQLKRMIGTIGRIVVNESSKG